MPDSGPHAKGLTGGPAEERRPLQIRLSRQADGQKHPRPILLIAGREAVTSLFPVRVTPPKPVRAAAADSTGYPSVVEG